MTERTKSGVFRRLPDSYEDLCFKIWIPRRLKDQVDLDNAIEIVDHLTRYPNLTEGQEEFLDVVSHFIEIYEAQEFPLESSSPLDVLGYLLDEHKMSPADLARLLGDPGRSLGTRILSGERDLSKEHIRTLAAHFRVPAGLFL